MISTKDIDERKIDENYTFRRYLKNHADEKKLDEQFKRLHNKYFKDFDCSKCRNCCKEIGVSMTEKELENICKHYNLDINNLKNNILEEEYGEYIASPCPFLEKDNSCKINGCLPLSCKEYPHTNKEERLYSLLGVVANSKVCPVVYHILEDLKKEYHFKSYR